MLALGASLAWGTADFVGGLKSRSFALPWVLLISQSTSLALLAVTVVVNGERAPDGGYLLYAAVAGLSEAAGIAALYRGFAVGTISIVAPVAALAPVVPLVVSVTLGEVPTPIQGIGLVLAVAGIVLASRQGGTEVPIARRGSSIVYGLIAACGFGAFFTAMDGASEGGIPWALFVARLTAVVAIGTIALLAGARPAVRWSAVPGVAGIGVLIVAGDAMYAIATTQGLLGIVAVLGALHTVVTIGWAWIYLHERLGGLQRLGIAASLCGVLAITV
ncbi:MAG: EamA family transporter [Thermoanaerobaculia bacterium]